MLGRLAGRGSPQATRALIKREAVAGRVASDSKPPPGQDMDLRGAGPARRAPGPLEEVTVGRVPRFDAPDGPGVRGSPH